MPVGLSSAMITASQALILAEKLHQFRKRRVLGESHGIRQHDIANALRTTRTILHTCSSVLGCHQPHELAVAIDDRYRRLAGALQQCHGLDDRFVRPQRHGTRGHDIPGHGAIKELARRREIRPGIRLVVERSAQDHAIASESLGGLQSFFGPIEDRGRRESAGLGGRHAEAGGNRFGDDADGDLRIGQCVAELFGPVASRRLRSAGQQDVELVVSAGCRQVTFATRLLQ